MPRWLATLVVILGLLALTGLALLPDRADSEIANPGSAAVNHASPEDNNPYADDLPAGGMTARR